MKLFNSNQIRQWDNFTIENEPVSSIDLMERASTTFVQWFIQKFNSTQPVYIFCGLGNNGGDGLVIARLLLQAGYAVKIFVLRYSHRTSSDFHQNYVRLKSVADVESIHSEQDYPIIPENVVVLDAIFGSGLNKPLEGLCADFVYYLNRQQAVVVSVDIPSGLFADQAGSGVLVVKAHYTVSFQIPKLAFLLPQNTAFVGEWLVLPIGLHPDFEAQTDSDWYLIDKRMAQALYRPRKPFAHKGDFGRALLCLGSYGKMGAAVLAARACLRAGVGLLSLYVPACGYAILQTAVPEAMVMTDESENYLENSPSLAHYHTVAIGCGIDTKNKTQRFLQKVLRNLQKPCVLDADALNIIAENPSFKAIIPPFSILTPHLKEFERLTHPAKDDFERLQLLQEFAQNYQVYVVLKGRYSTLATPDGKLFFNTSGNPGMATGGSGDVLTGILTGLLAQGYAPEEACVLGVYLHGLAGDLASEQVGQEALIASDIINHLGEAFKQLSGKKTSLSEAVSTAYHSLLQGLHQAKGSNGNGNGVYAHPSDLTQEEGGHGLSRPSFDF